MSDVTRILNQIEDGDEHAAEKLLPLVYDELRRLAARKISREKPGQTLQGTALVHEAYIRLVDGSENQRWDSRGHFFAAAAEAMRHMLVDVARKKKRIRHGGDHQRVDFEDDFLAIDLPVDHLLVIDEALTQLKASDPRAGQILELKYFAGLTTEEAAEMMGVPPRTAYRDWAYARSWILRYLGHSGPSSVP